MNPGMGGASGPIEAVLFDLHSTVLDQGPSAQWLAAAAQLLPAGHCALDARAAGSRRPWSPASGSSGSSESSGAGGLAPGTSVLDHPALRAGLDHLWDTAKVDDPQSLRDLDPDAHQELFVAMIGRLPLAEPLLPDVIDALYATQFAAWHAYADAAPTLTALRALGVRTAAVSNICHDVRPLLARVGLLDLFDTVVLSFQVGAVKPDAAIFDAALATLGVKTGAALMVGDSVDADGGAARHGIRTLVLPRTSGPEHGLGAVLGLVRATRSA